MTLSDFIRGRDVGVELILNEQRVREEIFKMVSERLIPHMIKNGNMNGNFSKGETNTTHHVETDSDWEIEEDAHGSPSIRSKLQILFEVQSDRAINAMQALNLGATGLASAITDNILVSLKKKYVGINTEKTSTKARISNGAVTGYDAKSKTDFESRN